MLYLTTINNPLLRPSRVEAAQILKADYKGTAKTHNCNFWKSGIWFAAQKHGMRFKGEQMPSNVRDYSLKYTRPMWALQWMP